MFLVYNSLFLFFMALGVKAFSVFVPCLLEPVFFYSFQSLLYVFFYRLLFYRNHFLKAFFFWEGRLQAHSCTQNSDVLCANSDDGRFVKDDRASF